MVDRKKAKKRAARGKTGSADEDKAPQASARATVAKIRTKVEKKLLKEVDKASLADYIRLVQFERELTEEEPRETKATWVDPIEREETDAS